MAEFERAGWNGGLNWYRVMDEDWAAAEHLHGAKVKVPVAFLAGAADEVLSFFGGEEKVRAGVANVCELPPLLPPLVAGCGHWLQQEAPGVVNGYLAAFLLQHGRPPRRKANL